MDHHFISHKKKNAIVRIRILPFDDDMKKGIRRFWQNSHLFVFVESTPCERPVAPLQGQREPTIAQIAWDDVLFFFEYQKACVVFFSARHPLFCHGHKSSNDLTLRPYENARMLYHQTPYLDKSNVLVRRATLSLAHIASLAKEQRVGLLRWNAIGGHHCTLLMLGKAHGIIDKM
jgi:hypothetical protein